MPATTSPVTLAELKAHLKVDIDEEDDLIASYNLAGADTVERYCSRVMVTRTLTHTLDAFPCGRRGFRLPGVPAAAVTSIVYNNDQGGTTTVASDQYRLKVGDPGVFAEVWPRDDNDYGGGWPDDLSDDPGGGHVTVTYTAGYGADGSGVPAPMKLAVMQLAATWFRARENVVIGTIVAEIPTNVEMLLSTYRVIDL